ncbi:MAG: RNA polymerase sigma-54 factor [Nitrospinae bacterium RIFCSPLOWO2_12_FULL_45_22]|nr:MAG: RNA polymerase sigma-54 factor [Nitrospinae bacterium RIFCSPLOWO2_12_FULL_45_22]
MADVRGRLELRQAPRLMMTTVLQQALQLLTLPRLELCQLIQQQMLENPLLEDAASEEEQEEDIQVNGITDGVEEGAGEFDIDWENYVWDKLDLGYTEEHLEEYISPGETLSKRPTLMEYLLWQLNLSSRDEMEKRIGAAIIGEIDEDGYFRDDLQEIANQFGLKKAEAEKVLKLIQTFDPPGVGARTLKECLLLQVKDLEQDKWLLEKIIKKYLEGFEPRNYARIARALKVPLEEILRAAQLIRSLNPVPGAKFQDQPTEYIVPDVFVIKNSGEYQVIINDDGVPRLRINSFYKSVLRSDRDKGNPTRQYIEDKFRSALWLLRGIEHRRRTIYKVTNSIVKLQRDFLDFGINYLKPLVLNDVAQDVGLHGSTVSRVANSKYMDTPQGLFEFKFFFHSGLESVVGGPRSSVVVKNMLMKFIGTEDPNDPHTDDQLVELFKENNIVIARRTVNKYRRKLKIPDSSERKRSAQTKASGRMAQSCLSVNERVKDHVY